MSFITPPSNKQESTHPSLSFRAGPIRMGRAKNLPVGGNDAGYADKRCRIMCALEGEILPAVGRRERTACGRQDDSIGGCNMCLLAFPPAGGDPSPCGVQDDTRRAGQENAKKHESSPAVCHSSRHPTTSKDQPTKRCQSEPALYAWAVRRISQLAERVRGYAASVGVHYRPRGGDPPCRWQAQANAGLRMTALGNAICVC